MEQSCIHKWISDTENWLYEDCTLCSAIRRIRDFCPDCKGRKWNKGIRIDDEGYSHEYRAPCGACGASGLIAIEPKIL